MWSRRYKVCFVGARRPRDEPITERGSFMLDRVAESCCLVFLATDGADNYYWVDVLVMRSSGNATCGIVVLSVCKLPKCVAVSKSVNMNSKSKSRTQACVKVCVMEAYIQRFLFLFRLTPFAKAFGRSSESSSRSFDLLLQDLGSQQKDPFRGYLF